jgi:hypothetical protein
VHRRLALLLLPLVPLVPLLAAADASGAQARERSGTWSARASSGLTLVGTWTAVVDTAAGTVTGSWTLADAQGRQAAGGGWSAAKTSARWRGAWRSVVAGSGGEYAGTWTADRLPANAPFADLFEQAVRAAVSGTWRAGGRSGAWSIRTAADAGRP